MKNVKLCRFGFTLTEIVIAVGVMGFALIPLMGIIWGGVRRTDISVTYENAAQIGASIMEFLLSDAVQFNHLDFSNPAAGADATDFVVVGYNNVVLSKNRRSSGFRAAAGDPFGTGGDVNSWLGESCESTGAACTDFYATDRFFKVGRENYHTALYIGAYYSPLAGAAAMKPTSMSYAYMSSPFMDYEKCMVTAAAPGVCSGAGDVGNPQRFYDTLILSAADVNSADCALNFSPYYACDGAGAKIWSFDRLNVRQTYDQLISLPMNNDTLPAFPGHATAQFTNFAKIQLFITWGKTWLMQDANISSSRGEAKTLQLVSFKGRFDSI
jgi:type II secretory pathway pseudopilin PulG